MTRVPQRMRETAPWLEVLSPPNQGVAARVLGVALAQISRVDVELHSIMMNTGDAGRGGGLVGYRCHAGAGSSRRSSRTFVVGPSPLE